MFGEVWKDLKMTTEAEKLATCRGLSDRQQAATRAAPPQESTEGRPLPSPLDLWRGQGRLSRAGSLTLSRMSSTAPSNCVRWCASPRPPHGSRRTCTALQFVFCFVLETIRTGATRVIHVIVKTEKLRKLPVEKGCQSSRLSMLCCAKDGNKGRPLQSPLYTLRGQG